ncbi:MAG: type IV pilus biogenesis/stability protein PilW [Proteobacteria bacterium]|nr:type IV pilus biogenesis/stability protein PilW [Pseudomonadota bacterium]
MKRIFLIAVLMLAGCVAVKPQGNDGPNKSAKVHTELAGLYFERIQMGIALSEIAQALQADPNYAPAYNVRGLIHMSLREDSAAEADFLQSLRLDKTDSEAQNNYGWFLCQRGREMESIPHFMEAVKNPLYTTPERAYLNAGLCFQKAGNNKDAEDFLQRALRLQPDLPQAQLAMSELKFAGGDYLSASKYFAAQKNENLTAAQLWLAVRIERRVGNANAEASYNLQLRQHYPDSPETQLMLHGE